MVPSILPELSDESPRESQLQGAAGFSLRDRSSLNAAPAETIAQAKACGSLSFSDRRSFEIKRSAPKGSWTLVAECGSDHNGVMAVSQLNLTGRPLVMGILNVTPDSFSDGGRFMDVDHAVGHAEQMIHDGADIIDVGGESTRPGSQAVPATEQIKQTQPVIASIRERHAHIPISIDTQSAEVASAALDSGATIVNDVSALRTDSEMACRVADAGAYVVLMHMQGIPRTMQQNPRYDDVVGEVETFLKERIEFAISNGIRRERIIIDPGIGFGKTVEHNLQILANLRRFAAIGPVLLGTSRKSLFAGLLGIDKVEERLTSTIVTNTIGLLAGVRILRVHDVKEAGHAVTLCGEIMRHTVPGARVS